MTTLELLKAAAIEAHRADADFQTSADPFSERRCQDAERFAIGVLRRWGGELREETERQERRLANAISRALTNGVVR